MFKVLSLIEPIDETKLLKTCVFIEQEKESSYWWGWLWGGIATMAIVEVLKIIF
jgi:hypothetical protein